MDVRNKVVTSQVMMPHHANPAGNVHGGEIMKVMDNAAYAVALKYAKGNCVTARVDELEFHLPIFVGALVTCTASIVYVGRTSMEVLEPWMQKSWTVIVVRNGHCPLTSPWYAWERTAVRRKSASHIRRKQKTKSTCMKSHWRRSRS